MNAHRNRLFGTVVSVVLLGAVCAAYAQQPAPLPDALAPDATSSSLPSAPSARKALPMPPKAPREPGGAYDFLFRGSLACGGGAAQLASGQATTPMPSKATNPGFLDNDTMFTTLFAGAGTSLAGSVHPASAQFGASAGAETFPDSPGKVGSMMFVELGALGPLADRPAPAWFVSYDLGMTFLPTRNSHVIPFAAAGYTYVFSQASALNFGVGADFHYQTYRAVRLELRDYYTFTRSPEHNLALRLGWQFSANNP